MATWPTNPKIIGTRVPRVDGLAKASGRVKYPSDVRPAGTLFGVMVYSPYAHATVKSIDLTKAKAMPGVKAALALIEPGKAVRYQGDDVAALCAETEEQARDAAKAVEVVYTVLPHCVTEAQSMAEGAPKIITSGNVRKGRSQTDQDPDAAMAKADVTIEGTYTAPVITHVCLETHGLTAEWKTVDGKDKVTAWASTQAVAVSAGELANALNVPLADVTVHTEVMGGGFGSKFGPDIWGITAARLSKAAGGMPVRLFLDRVQEHLAAGNRPSVSGTIKLGATKDGKIISMIAETFGTGGITGGAEVQMPYVYKVASSRRSHSNVYVNAGNQRAMRAPGHPQRCIVMESAMDDLADKLGLDPIEVRLANLGPNDPVTGGVNRTEIYKQEIAIGAELIGWKANRKARGQSGGKGPIRRGYGMALHQWAGGGSQDKQVGCIINPDGSVEVRSATQDLGTGARTLLAIIAAEVLGLAVADIKSNIGHSDLPVGQASGGSTTTPSMCPPCYNAATQAKEQFLARVATAMKVEVGKLGLADGKLTLDGNAEMSFKDACRKLNMVPVSVTAGTTPGLSSNGVGGVQFAEVTVDIETGVVRLKKIVAVQDSGLIVNKSAWESQVYGGVIGGLNYGLFEERVMDPTSGIMLNPDMEMYKLAGASDIPEIVVHALDTPEMRARGVIGIGEPPTISTAAAIGNAVTNAIGVRVPNFPMSPMNVLNALATVDSSKGRREP